VLDIPFLKNLQSRLADPMMDDDALRTRLEENLALLEVFARSWQALASADYPELARFVANRGDSGMLDLSAALVLPTGVLPDSRQPV
jgi:hypothetical protein